MRLPFALPAGGFDAVISFLAILHVDDRPGLFRKLSAALRAGGQCYVEDLCQRAPWAPADLQDLRRIVHGVSVTSIGDYASDLRQEGLVDVVATDLTDDWAPMRLSACRRGAPTASTIRPSMAKAPGRPRSCSTPPSIGSIATAAWAACD